MLKLTLLHQFYTLSRISSETKVNLQCVATILASFVGFVLSCLILGDYGPYGGYYGGDDTISYYHDDDMIDGVLIPGL